eukprot:gene29866-33710_t
MNVAMLGAHDRLQASGAPLGDADHHLVQSHPQAGVVLLRQAGIEHAGWLACVLAHHENEDGTGYPGGKTGPYVPESAKLVALADRYCARLAPRRYRKRMTPNAALRDLLLDGDKEAVGKDYFRLSGIDHTTDHAFGIWGYDDKGSEYYTLRIRDLATKQDLDDVLENTAGGGVWAPDGKSFFYTLQDENHRPSKVFHHIVGQPQSSDRLVYEETDPGFFMGVGGSLLDDFIFIDIHDHETSEYRLLSTKDLTAEPQLVAEREEGVEYSMTEGGDVFYILTNADGAKDFKIVEAPVTAPGKANWKELVPHEPGRLILNHMAFARHLVWLERREGLPVIMIRDRKSGEEHSIAF